VRVRVVCVHACVCVLVCVRVCCIWCPCMPVCALLWPSPPFPFCSCGSEPLHKRATKRHCHPSHVYAACLCLAQVAFYLPQLVQSLRNDADGTIGAALLHKAQASDMFAHQVCACMNLYVHARAHVPACACMCALTSHMPVMRGDDPHISCSYDRRRI